MPCFGKKLLLAKGPEGKRVVRSLPLIPGTRLPDSESEAERSARESQQVELAEGARPSERFIGEYVIGAGDVLDVVIWQGLLAEKRPVQVSERGLISFGYVDDVQAAGLTVKELDGILTQRL